MSAVITALEKTYPEVGLRLYVPLAVSVLSNVSSGFLSVGTFTVTIAFSSPVFPGSAITVYCPLASTEIALT